MAIIITVIVIISIGGSQIVLRPDLVPQVHPSHPRVVKVSLRQQLQTFGWFSWSLNLNIQNLESTSPQDTRWCTRVPRHRGVSSTTWLCWCGCSIARSALHHSRPDESFGKRVRCRCGCSTTRSAWHLSKPDEPYEWKYPVFQCLTWTAWSRSSNEVIPTNSGFADRRSPFTRVLSLKRMPQRLTLITGSIKMVSRAKTSLTQLNPRPEIC